MLVEKIEQKGLYNNTFMHPELLAGVTTLHEKNLHHNIDK